MGWFNRSNKKIEEDREFRKRESEEREKKQKIDFAQRLWDKGGLRNLTKARDIYSEYNYNTRKRKLEIEIAKEKEELLDYKGALFDFERLGLHKSSKRVRQKLHEQGAVKVDQTVVHGDYVDDRDTIVKDSVINRSNVGGGSDDKIAKLEKIAEMKEKGLIDDDDYEKMKREIVG